LGLDSIDLYYLHFPFSPVGITPWIRAMAQAVEAQKIRAVGVSNCSAAQMRRGAATLARYDIVLGANQVHYSATHRQPEKNGVLDTCREMDVALVTYRPVEGGSLRSEATNGSNATLRALEEVAQRHNATVTHVALAWLLQRDNHVVAIPGSTNADHIRDNAQALMLELTADDVAAIDRAG
jgi:diketogulonate reductase-like aldo/keto reductase